MKINLQWSEFWLFMLHLLELMWFWIFVLELSRRHDTAGETKKSIDLHKVSGGFGLAFQMETWEAMENLECCCQFKSRLWGHLVAVHYRCIVIKKVILIVWRVFFRVFRSIFPVFRVFFWIFRSIFQRLEYFSVFWKFSKLYFSGFSKKFKFFSPDFSKT